MGGRMSQSFCCSVREKNDRVRGLPVIGSPQFWCIEVEMRIEKPCHISFAPLWNNDGSPTKRLALAGGNEVHVYRVNEEMLTTDVPQLLLERTLTLDSDQVVHGLIFSEESSSRNLVTAFGPASGQPGRHSIRVWNCEAAAGAGPPGGKPGEPLTAMAWRPNEDYALATKEDHAGPVTKLAVSPTYLLSADSLGECRVWQKNKGFASRAQAKLHSGGIADLVVDRLFAYSVGVEECCIKVWSVPDLSPVLNIDASTLSVYLANLGEIGRAPDHTLPIAAPEPYRIEKLTALRRPTSRWAGSQGSSRNVKTPKGSIYVAGTLAEDSEAAPAGSGILMEWSLGATPTCHCAQVAHDSSISTLAYGPYDNGPLVTADSNSVFRVWDCVPRLHCSQSVEIAGAPSAGLAVAVEPFHGLYSVIGDKRLFIWRRYHPAELACEPF